MVEEARTIGFFRFFQPIDKTGKELTLNQVTLLRSMHFFRIPVVVTNIVPTDGDVFAIEQTLDWLTEGHDPGAVCLHG